MSTKRSHILKQTCIFKTETALLIKEFDKKSWGFIIADQIGDWRIRQISWRQVFVDY